MGIAKPAIRMGAVWPAWALASVAVIESAWGPKPPPDPNSFVTAAWASARVAPASVMAFFWAATNALKLATVACASTAVAMGTLALGLELTCERVDFGNPGVEHSAVRLRLHDRARQLVGTRGRERADHGRGAVVAARGLRPGDRRLRVWWPRPPPARAALS